MESPETDTEVQQLEVDKGTKATQLRIHRVFNKWFWSNWTPTFQNKSTKQNNLGKGFVDNTKISSKWTINQNENAKL